MKNKLLISSSAGGHLYEASRLHQIFIDFDTTLITEHTESIYSLPYNNVKSIPYYDGKNKLMALCVIFNSFIEALKCLLNNDVRLHISFGSHVSVGAVIACYVFRVKTIHIESYTRVNELSKSGKVIKYFADVFIVQWPQLTIHHKVTFVGSLF